MAHDPDGSLELDPVRHEAQLPWSPTADWAETHPDQPPRKREVEVGVWPGSRGALAQKN